jgi:hypothetical protein
VGYAVIKAAPNDPEWFFYFQLCFGYWKDLYARYRVFFPIVQAALAFALQSGAINGHTASLLIEEIRVAGKHHDSPEESLTSAVLDFELAMKNLQQAKMDSIAKHFEELLMFEEFTNSKSEMMS